MYKDGPLGYHPSWVGSVTLLSWLGIALSHPVWPAAKVCEINSPSLWGQCVAGGKFIFIKYSQVSYSLYPETSRLTQRSDL